MEGNIDAHLTVTSLGLLGFNTDEYLEMYPGIAHELPPIKLITFDRENEPALLCCLHFLLTKLDYEEFTYAIEECWPYLTSKGKSNYKYAVFSSLQRLRDNDVVDVFEKVSPVFWTLHFSVKGYEVWTLLRALSDACVEMAIKELHPAHESHTMSAPHDEENMQHGSEENELFVMPPVVRRKSIVQLQAEGFQSIHTAEKKLGECSSPIDNGQSRDHMLAYITEIQRQVEELIITHIAKQNRQTAYMEELDERLKIARLSLDASQKRIRKSTQNGAFYVLTDAARRQRVGKLERIASSLHLLEELSHSVLLTETQRHLQEDSSDPALNGLSLTYLAQDNAKAEHTQAVDNEDSITGLEFHRVCEAGQRQVDTAMLGSHLYTAIDALTEALDAACACYVETVGR